MLILIINKKLKKNKIPSIRKMLHMQINLINNKLITCSNNFFNKIFKTYKINK